MPSFHTDFHFHNIYGRKHDFQKSERYAVQKKFKSQSNNYITPIIGLYMLTLGL